MDGMKKIIIGAIVSFLGMISLLKNVTITSGEDNSLGALVQQLLGGGETVAKTSAAIMVIVVIAVLAMCIKPCFVTFAIFALSVVAVMIDIISNMKLVMADMPASEFIMLFACIGIGLGVALNGAYHYQKEKKYESQMYDDVYF